MTDLKLQTALFKAAKLGHISLVRELIKIGADPFAKDIRCRDIFYYVKRENPLAADALFEELEQAWRLKSLEIF